MGARDILIGMQPRGLNKDEAAKYLGLARRAFDSVSEQLKPFRAGTALIYDRHDLDELFERLKAGVASSAEVEEAAPESQDEQPNIRINQKKPWAARRASTATKNPVATGSTSAIGNTDYASISAAIKKQKSG